MKSSIKCPICRRETTWKDNPYRPFCSERCQNTDLARWADGDYAIVGPPAKMEDEQKD